MMRNIKKLLHILHSIVGTTDVHCRQLLIGHFLNSFFSYQELIK